MAHGGRRKAIEKMAIVAKLNNQWRSRKYQQSLTKMA
jgi:hypothetical protein